MAKLIRRILTVGGNFKMPRDKGKTAVLHVKRDLPFRSFTRGNLKKIPQSMNELNKPITQIL